jgi:hypothetical protein
MNHNLEILPCKVFTKRVKSVALNKNDEVIPTIKVHGKILEFGKVNVPRIAA